MLYTATAIAARSTIMPMTTNSLDERERGAPVRLEDGRLPL